jgi:dienelactone hydrolase
VKAGSGLRAAARRAGTAIAAVALIAAQTGCAGSGSGDHGDATRGVKAHRLADEPARNGGRAGGYAARDDGDGHAGVRAGRVGKFGPHPVAIRDLRVRRDGLYGEWYRPKDQHGRMPAVVAFGGSKGGLLAMPRFAHGFASEGYPALALAYFKEPGLPKELANIPLEYFARAIKWVQRQPGVDPDKVVLLGISRGGEGALLIGSVYPQLVHGVIALVPNHEVNPGWSRHGGRVTPYQFIKVERIRGPILTASGGRDEVWSSSVFTEQIEQRLNQHHFRYPHERLNFPKAGHALAGTAPVIWPRILRLMRRLREAPPGPPRAS